MHSKEAAKYGRLCRYRRVQEKRPDRDCLNGGSYSLSDVDFCSVCFFDTGSCGKCVGADGKRITGGQI